MTVTRDEVDTISGELWQLGTLGIEEVDAGTTVTLLAGFNSAISADDAAKQLKRFAVVEEFGSGDYLDPWRDFASIYRAGNRFVVKPPWVVTSQTQANWSVDRPGRSFGSGSHPPTRLAFGST
ncbi:MAG: hypothetical protein Ct9H300mP26_1310 [Acidimicrobiales bacterium]|nr:MAG: hypothetical protein Ct9H300mP26_1310 [Acidimicrobiales bacterium]